MNRRKNWFYKPQPMIRGIVELQEECTLYVICLTSIFFTALACLMSRMAYTSLHEVLQFLFLPFIVKIICELASWVFIPLSNVQESHVGLFVFLVKSSLLSHMFGRSWLIRESWHFNLPSAVLSHIKLNLIA